MNLQSVQFRILINAHSAQNWLSSLFFFILKTLQLLTRVDRNTTKRIKCETDEKLRKTSIELGKMVQTIKNLTHDIRN